MKETLYDVFISHASEDKQIAEAMVHHFESQGIRCFLAKDKIPVGANWPGQLTTAIKSSKALVLIVSEDSNKSEPVLKEINLASSSGLHIVQFKVAKVALNPDLEFHLANKHWLDAIDPPMAVRIEELGSAMCRLLNIKPKPPFVIDGPKDPTKGMSAEGGKPSRFQYWPQMIAAGAALLVLVLGALWVLDRTEMNRQKKADDELIAQKEKQLAQLRTAAPQQPQPVPAQPSVPASNAALSGEWDASARMAADALSKASADKQPGVLEEKVRTVTDQLKTDARNQSLLIQATLFSHRLGEFHQNMGNSASSIASAIAAFEKGLGYARELVRLDGNERLYHRELGMMLVQYGWSLHWNNQFAECEARMNEGLKLIEPLKTDEPDSICDLGIVLLGLGNSAYIRLDAAWNTGNKALADEVGPKAKNALGRARDVMNSLPLKSKNYVESKNFVPAMNSLNIANQLVAIVQYAGGDYKTALQVRRDNVQVVKRRLHQAPSDPLFQSDVSGVQGHLIESLIHEGDLAEAKSVLSEALQRLGDMKKQPQFQDTDDFRVIVKYLESLKGSLLTKQ